MIGVDNVIAFPACEALPLVSKPAPMLTGHDVERIETLRACAKAALLVPRCDVDRACALITADKTESVSAYATTLLALLAEFSFQKTVFYPNGAEEFSDSEVWLSRALRAAQHGHSAQARALVSWRVKPMGHRRALYLIDGLAEAFCAQLLD
ncbi:MAG: hypothetical protein AAFY64_00225 [Pseudomonadota bacterium]